MSWSDCGKDSTGRPIGYAFTATCDQEGCTASIDRGLSFACGGMHGQDEVSCERYFCDEHLAYTVDTDEHLHLVCEECAKLLKADGEWADDNQEGTIVRVSPASLPDPAD